MINESPNQNKKYAKREKEEIDSIKLSPYKNNPANRIGNYILSTIFM